MPCSTTSGLPLLGCCHAGSGYRPFAKSITLEWHYGFSTDYRWVTYDNRIDAAMNYLAGLDMETVMPGYNAVITYNVFTGQETRSDSERPEFYINEDETLVLINAVSTNGVIFDFGYIQINRVSIFDGPFNQSGWCAHAQEGVTGPQGDDRDLLSCANFSTPFDYICPKATSSPRLYRYAQADFYWDTNPSQPPCCNEAP